MKAIVIDDEPMALEVIRSMSQKVPFIVFDSFFTNAFKALEYLKDNEVDLIFIDIQMPDINGIEFIESLTKKPMFILTTAHSEYAVQSYEVDATDYLLKPFSFPRFLRACNKAFDQFQPKNSLNELQSTTILVKSGYEKVLINIDQINFVESKGNNVNINCQDKTVISRMTMTEFENLIPANTFIRVHRSFLVAKNKIEKGDKTSVSVNGIKIPIGLNYSVDLENLI